MFDFVGNPADLHDSCYPCCPAAACEQWYNTFLHIAKVCQAVYFNFILLYLQTLKLDFTHKKTQNTCIYHNAETIGLLFR